MSYAELVLDADTRGLIKAKRDLAGVRDEGARTERGVAASMRSASRAFGGVAAAAAGALAAIVSVGSAVNTIREFESSMSKVAAISGATGRELERLTDTAKDLGTTTEFSASQAADGLSFLAMAGFSASESIEAIPAVLDLATASGMGLASAADIASNVLSGFGMSAGEAGTASDILAAAASKANTDVGQLGRAMSTVAPISASLGIDMAETAAAIGKLSDAGIQGERAGTALRGVMAALAGPTDQAQEALAAYGLTVDQVDPAAVGLAQALSNLDAAGLSTADAMTIFGREAASGALVLADAANDVGALTVELEKSQGAAADMAATMRDNLGGDFQSLMSAVQGLILELGDAGLTAVLRGVIQGVTEFVRAIAGAVGVIGGFFDTFSRAAEAARIHEAAIDSVSIAMGDQIRATEQLSIALNNGSIITAQMAAAKLEEARARRAVIEALIDERREAELAAMGYGSLLEQLADTQSALAALRTPGDDLEDMPLRMRDAYEETEQTLISLLNRQQEMLSIVRAGNHLREDEQAHLDEIDANIAALIARQKELGLKTSETVELSSRIPPPLDQATNSAANLVTRLQLSAQYAMQLAMNLAQAPVGIANLESQAAKITAQISAIDAGYDQITASAAGYRKELEEQYGLAEAAGAAEEAYISGVINRQVKEYENVQRLNKEYQNKVRSLNKVSAAGGGVAKSMGSAAKSATNAANATSDFADEIQRLEWDANPLLEYNHELERLDTLMQNGLSQGAYTHAVDELNDKFRETPPIVDDISGAFGDFVASGLKDFKGFADSVLSSFKNMISQMVSEWARTNLFGSKALNFTMGGGRGGGAGGIAQQAMGGGGGGGGGGLLGGLLGKFGSKGGGIFGAIGGGSGFLGGLGSALSGGLGNVFSIGANAAAAGGTLMATLGAAVPVIGAVALAFSAFRKKTVNLDKGVQATITNMDALIETFSQDRTTRLFGLSRKTRTTFSEADDATAQPIQEMINAIQGGVVDAAAALGVGAEAFEGFSAKIKISTKGLSEDEALRVWQEHLNQMGHDFATMAFQVGDDLLGLVRDGEQAHLALDAMVNSLTLSNSIFKNLGHSAMEASLQTGALARDFVDMLGGMDQALNTTTNYMQQYYTEQEQLDAATRNLNDAFSELGWAVPATTEDLRAWIDQAMALGDLDTAGRLISLSDAFYQVTTATEQATLAAEQSAVALEQSALAAKDAVGSIFQDLGGAMLDTSSQTGEAAQVFLEALGGMDSAMQVSAGYMQNFYSDQERLDAATRNLNDTFSELGWLVPATVEDFRAWVDEAMALGDLDTVANLLSVSDAFYQVTAASEQAALASEQAAISARQAADDFLASVQTKISSGMTAIANDFGTLEQQLEFFSNEAQAAFTAAGLVMPETGQAFAAAATEAAANVDRIIGLYNQGKAKIEELEQAKAQQLAIFDLHDEAKKVYDLQDRIEANRARNAQETANSLNRLSRAATDASSSVDRAAERLASLQASITGAIRDIGGLGAQGASVSRMQALNIVALANATGEAWEATFGPALQALSDIDPNDFADRVSFDRARAQAQNLLASTRDRLSRVNEGERPPSKFQVSVANRQEQQQSETNRLLQRLLRIEQERGIA